MMVIMMSIINVIRSLQAKHWSAHNHHISSRHLLGRQQARDDGILAQPPQIVFRALSSCPAQDKTTNYCPGALFCNRFKSDTFAFIYTHTMSVGVRFASAQCEMIATVRYNKNQGRPKRGKGGLRWQVAAVRGARANNTGNHNKRSNGLTERRVLRRHV